MNAYLPCYDIQFHAIKWFRRIHELEAEIKLVLEVLGAGRACRTAGIVYIHTASISANVKC